MFRSLSDLIIPIEPRFSLLRKRYALAGLALGSYRGSLAMVSPTFNLSTYKRRRGLTQNAKRQGVPEVMKQITMNG